MRFFGLLITQLFVTTAALIAGVWGQADAQDHSFPAFEIAGSEVRTLRSPALNRSYDLYVKLPPGYRSARSAQRRYPVIYFNDAGYCWVTAVGITRPAFNFGAYERAILVGLSYAEGESGASSRIRDLTPTEDKDWAQATGGARAYLDFIKTKVIPFVDDTYRTDPGRRMLVGQSLGGLFGAYALIEEPGVFHDYILTSASLWFDDKTIFDLEKSAAKTGRVLSGRVYFAIGETEGPASGRRIGHDMVGQQKAFARQLLSRKHDGLEVQSEVLDGGTHLTTYPIGFTRAMRWLLPGPDIYNGGSR